MNHDEVDQRGGHVRAVVVDGDVGLLLARLAWLAQLTHAQLCGAGTSPLTPHPVLRARRWTAQMHGGRVGCRADIPYRGRRMHQQAWACDAYVFASASAACSAVGIGD